MKCELIETKYGWKLCEIGTGKLYGYVRGDRKKTEDELLAEIRAEIEAKGFYEAHSGGRQIDGKDS